MTLFAADAHCTVYKTGKLHVISRSLCTNLSLKFIAKCLIDSYVSILSPTAAYRVQCFEDERAETVNVKLIMKLATLAVMCIK